MCEYSRSRSFHYDLILQDQASGERSQDQWSSGFFLVRFELTTHGNRMFYLIYISTLSESLMNDGEHGSLVAYGLDSGVRSPWFDTYCIGVMSMSTGQ